MDTYTQRLADLGELKHLTLSKKMSGPDSNVFAIRGTAIFLRTNKHYINPFDDESPLGYSSQWIIKVKKYFLIGNKNQHKYIKLSFEEVLDHPSISENARQELIFNLDMFVKNKGV